MTVSQVCFCRMVAGAPFFFTSQKDRQVKIKLVWRHHKLVLVSMSCPLCGRGGKERSSSISDPYIWNFLLLLFRGLKNILDFASKPRLSMYILL